MGGSIAQQSVEELGGEGSILVRQRRDHAELDRLMTRYERREGTEQELRRTLKDIVQLTFSHAFAEETVLWPLVRRDIADGEELTARVETEHQEINELVAEIERTDAAEPRHADLVTRAFALIRQDIRDEEDLCCHGFRRPTTKHASGRSGPRGRPFATRPPPTPTPRSPGGLRAMPCWGCR